MGFQPPISWRTEEGISHGRGGDKVQLTVKSVGNGYSRSRMVDHTHIAIPLSFPNFNWPEGTWKEQQEQVKNLLVPYMGKVLSTKLSTDGLTPVICKGDKKHVTYRPENSVHGYCSGCHSRIEAMDRRRKTNPSSYKQLDSECDDCSDWGGISLASKKVWYNA
jgi:hypothetical protein